MKHLNLSYMKYLSAILFTLIWNLILNTLSAQDIKEEKFSIQLVHGISRTLHYNQPVRLFICFEGCTPIEQKARFASNMHLGLYYAMSKRNSVKLGVGISEYRFLEKGIDHGGGDAIYKYDMKFVYFNFGAGYRHIFERKNRISPVIESEILCELFSSDDYLLRNLGVAIQQKAGVVILISERWRGVIEGFYKSAIMPYNDRNFDKNYFPFGYGLQVGMNLIL